MIRIRKLYKPLTKAQHNEHIMVNTVLSINAAIKINTNRYNKNRCGACWSYSENSPLIMNLFIYYNIISFREINKYNEEFYTFFLSQNFILQALDTTNSALTSSKSIFEANVPIVHIK